MAKLQLHIEPRHPNDGEALDVEPLDIATALMIANINLHRGAAEIWDGPTLLCRMVKHGAGLASYWEINPDAPQAKPRPLTAAAGTTAHR